MEVFIIKKEIKLMYLKILKWLGINDSFLGYIAGADKLPPPLEERDELELLKKLKYNDKEAKNILVEKNLRLVVYIAKKFENSGVNIEDLISIGTIGLMKAINSYDLDKNIKLATYASRCIENEILMFLRKNNKIKTEISIDEPINIDSEEQVTVIANPQLIQAIRLAIANGSIFKDMYSRIILKENPSAELQELVIIPDSMIESAIDDELKNFINSDDNMQEQLKALNEKFADIDEETLNRIAFSDENDLSKEDKKLKEEIQTLMISAGQTVDSQMQDSNTKLGKIINNMNFDNSVLQINKEKI